MTNAYNQDNLPDKDKQPRVRHVDPNIKVYLVSKKPKWQRKKP